MVTIERSELEISQRLDQIADSRVFDAQSLRPPEQVPPVQVFANYLLQVLHRQGKLLQASKELIVFHVRVANNSKSVHLFVGCTTVYEPSELVSLPACLDVEHVSAQLLASEGFVCRVLVNEMAQVVQ